MTRYKIQPKKCKLVADGAAISLPTRAVKGPFAARAVARHLLADLPHESMLAICLNTAARIVAVVEVSRGGVNGTAITPADVLRPVLVSGARAFVLAHNHPSGSAVASPEDIATTTHLLNACAAVGVTLLDHIIIGDDTSAMSETHPELF